MPAIVVKDYTWRQTDDTIVINTPLFGNPRSVDLFVVNNYVKASYPPFILELFLWGSIIDEESECVLNKEQAKVIFTLKKADLGVTWPSLVVEHLDKESQKERRIYALEQAQSLNEERAKARSEKIQKLQKQAVRSQINLDTAMLNKIDMHRDTERKEAMKDFEDWRSAAEDSILANIEGKAQENRKAYRPALKWFKDESGELKSREITCTEVFDRESTIKSNNTVIPKPLSQMESEFCNTKITNTSYESNDIELKHQESNLSPIPEHSVILQNDEDNESSDSSDSCKDSESDFVTTVTSCRSSTESFINELNEKRLKKFYKDKGYSSRKTTFRSKSMIHRNFKANTIFDEPQKAVPMPRKNGLIDVEFSERRFPTPARESHQLEEQEWLEKQAEARRQTGFVVEDLRPEELDPQWLKDKGDEFFRAGNHLGAISAYSHGIKLSPKMSSLYSNRSAAHYALGNYIRCTEDCSKALELMVPHCKGNLGSRAKCHARRGAALCKLASPQHGIPELEAALRLDPKNTTIECDLQAARQYFNVRE